MANRDNPSGARPYGKNSQAEKYIAGAEVFEGDFVHLESDGKVDPTGGTESLCGVAASYASADGQDLLVWDDPDQKFVVQSDSGDIDATTDINLNYNITVTGGSGIHSRMELDGDTGATTATLPLKLLKIEDRADNVLGTSVDCVIIINNHSQKGGTGTAGI